MLSLWGAGTMLSLWALAPCLVYGELVPMERVPYANQMEKLSNAKIMENWP